MKTIMKLAELSAFIKFLLEQGKVIHTTDDKVTWETKTGLAEVKEHRRQGQVIGNEHATWDMLQFEQKKLSKNKVA